MKQDHESVRTLAIAIGVRKAARQLGLSEDRVRQWSKRENWFKLPMQPPQQGAVTTVTKPGDILLSEIERNGSETRLHLSKAHLRHAKLASAGKMKPRETLQTAQGAQITHGWRNSDKDQAQVAVNIAILSA